MLYIFFIRNTQKDIMLYNNNNIINLFIAFYQQQYKNFKRIWRKSWYKIYYILLFRVCSVVKIIKNKI